MKRIIEKLTNHLGIPGYAPAKAILEKMQGLPGLTAVADLQNSLKNAPFTTAFRRAERERRGK